MIGIYSQGAKPHENDKLRKLILSRVFKGEKDVDIKFTTAHSRLQVYAVRFEKEFLMFEGYPPRDYDDSRRLDSGSSFEEQILKETKERSERVLNYFGEGKPKGGAVKKSDTGVGKGTGR